MAYKVSGMWILCAFIAILLCGLAIAGTTPASTAEPEPPAEPTPEATTTPPRAPLKVSTKVMEPYVMINKTVNATEKFRGYVIDLLAKAMMDLDFEYNLQEAKEPFWGETIGNPEDNVWTGIIGEAQRGDVDLVAAPVTVTERRKTAVAFITSFDTVGTAVLMRNDSKIKDQDALLKSNFSIGIVKGDPIFRKLRGHAKHAKLLSRINANPQLPNLDDALAKVREGHYALLMNNATAEYTMATNKPCNLIMTNIDIEIQHYAFAVKNGSDLKAPLDAAIKKLIDNGENRKLRDKWFTGTCGAQGLTLTHFVLILAIIGAFLVKN